jgi:lipopolysaccharide biosynthesis glycosyltransferase
MGTLSNQSLDELGGKRLLAVVFAATDNMAFALGAALLSFRENSPKLFAKAKFFVFSQNLSDKNKEILSQIADIVFKDFKPPFSTDKIKTINVYSPVSLARYECFNMLADFKNVLWLDIDILILKELEDILSFRHNGMALASDGHKVSFNFFKTPLYVEGVEKNKNSGVILFSDALKNPQEIAAWCYAKTYEKAALLRFPDQGILNWALQTFSIQTQDLPLTFNTSLFSTPVKIRDAHILHAMGIHKFWNAAPFKDWFTFYSRWQNLGGQPIPSQKINKCVSFLFKLRLNIEKIPILWNIFKIWNEKRLQKLNKKHIKEQDI